MVAVHKVQERRRGQYVIGGPLNKCGCTVHTEGRRYRYAEDLFGHHEHQISPQVIRHHAVQRSSWRAYEENVLGSAPHR